MYDKFSSFMIVVSRIKNLILRIRANRNVNGLLCTRTRFLNIARLVTSLFRHRVFAIFLLSGTFLGARTHALRAYK